MIKQESIKLDINIPIPMKDGTITYADIRRPDTTDKLPVILVRTPYNKTMPNLFTFLDPIRMVRAGYISVIQDTRGTGASGGGTFDMGRSAPQDGYDTVEWVASQPWCDGNIGTMGISHLGAVQWGVVMTHPPHLKTIVPTFAPQRPSPVGVWEQWRMVVSGSRNLSGIVISHSNLSPTERAAAVKLQQQMIDSIEDQFAVLPLKDVPIFKQSFASLYGEALKWINMGDPNGLSQLKGHENVTVPILHIGGWYDFALNTVIENYELMKKNGGSEFARKNQHLLIGPWYHDLNFSSNIGRMDTGIASTGASIDLVGVHLRWFNHWLKGKNNGVEEEPPVRLFVMGENVWRSENEWPLARTQYTEFYFHSKGRANSRFGDGVLSTKAPDNEESDNYLYDPRKPVPTRGWVSGAGVADTTVVGAQYQQDIEEREDILVYSTEPLEKDLEVTGHLIIKLWAASSAVDTDFTGKLVDAFPDGRALNIGDGIVRARFRNPAKPEMIQPNEVYQYTIDMWSTSYVFKAGHCVRVEITSSNFPKYDRNLNTGHPIGQDAEIKVALQTVYHDKEHRSHIVLPIIPG